jgi:outer membrane lipoprotein SlyB
MNRLLLCLLAAASLAGCATSNPDVIRREDAQRMTTLQDATVLTVRPVVVDGNQSGAGGVVGGVVGGIAGASMRGQRESVVGGVLGAVAGAVIGNAIERSSTKEEALEITLQLRNGERRAIVQAKGKETFQPGDAVLIITSGSKVRVAHAPGNVPMPAPKLESDTAWPAASGSSSTLSAPVYTPR